MIDDENQPGDWPGRRIKSLLGKVLLVLEPLSDRPDVRALITQIKRIVAGPSAT